MNSLICARIASSSFDSWRVDPIQVCFGRLQKLVSRDLAVRGITGRRSRRDLSRYRRGGLWFSRYDFLSSGVAGDLRLFPLAAAGGFLAAA